MPLVRCDDCALFIPNEVTPSGLGDCRVYRHYLEKGIKGADIDALLRRLGNKPDIVLRTYYPLFWSTTLIDRKCEKYKPVVA